MTPKARQLLYSVGLIASGALTLLSVFKIIDPNTSSTVNAALSALLSIFGVGAAGTAAVVTGRQINQGMFDQQHQPAVQAATALEAVTKQYNDLLAQVNAGMVQVQQTAEALGQTVTSVPVAGPLLGEAINEANSLAQAAIDAVTLKPGDR